MTIELNIATIIYIATAIGTVGAAVKILAEAKKALTQPIDEIHKKMEHYDDCLDRDKKHLEKIDIAIKELGDATNLLVSASRVTLAHLKDGNHSGDIDKQLKQIDEWLVVRKDYKI
jgi:hypothetical protein